MGGDLFCLMLLHNSDLEPVSRSDGGRNLYTSNMGRRFLHCCRVSTGKWATKEKNASFLKNGLTYGRKYKTWKKPKMAY